MEGITWNDVGALLVVAAVVVPLALVGVQNARGRPGFAPIGWLPAAVWSVFAGLTMAGLGAVTPSPDLRAFLLGVGGSMLGAGIVVLAQGKD